MSIVTWDPNRKGSTISLHNNDLRAVCSRVSNTSAGVFCTVGKTEGKWYWEVSFSPVSDGEEMIGVANNNASFDINSSNGNAGIGTRFFRIYNRRLRDNVGGGGEKPTNIGDLTGKNVTFGFALDLDNGVLEMTVDGVLVDVVITEINTIVEGEIYPFFVGHRFNNDTTGGAFANFGATPFKYPIPDGYKPYDTSSDWWIPYKKLIKSGGNIYAVNSGSWLNIGQLPTDQTQQKQLFEQYGMDNITGEQIEQLKAQLGDNKKLKYLRGVISG